jgi:hypothetical protein
MEEDKVERYLPIPTTWDMMDWCEMNFSQESYDSLLGGPRPNGSSRTWYREETGNLHYPYNLGIWNFFSETGEWFDAKKLQNQHQPHVLDSNHCKFKFKEEIVGEKHLYVICVFNPDFFRLNRDLGFTLIDKQYQNDVRNGNAAVVVFYPWEGYSGMEGNEDFIIVEEWRKKSHFPEGSVHFFTGNLTANNHDHVKGSGLVMHSFNSFDNWNSDKLDLPLIKFEPKDDKYLFLSYNRNPRKNRVYLGAKLIEYDLLDKGLVSLGKPDWWSPNNTLRGEGIRDREYSKLDKLLPIEIGKKLFFNLACNIETQDFEQTFCSVITETLVEEGTLFISEKTWKALQLGHPFFVIGNPGTLNYLRNLGYKTFDKWWDESYDHVYEYRIRIEMITKELIRLSKKSKDELIKIRKEMEEVLDYNKALHYRTVMTKWGYGTSQKPEDLLRTFWNIYENLGNGKDIM